MSAHQHRSADTEGHAAYDLPVTANKALICKQVTATNAVQADFSSFVLIRAELECHQMGDRVPFIKSQMAQSD